MILRRDPRMVWMLALMALGIVAVVGVTVLALYRWKDNPAPRYSVAAIYSMGVVMVGTWLIITLASIPDADIYREMKPLPDDGVVPPKYKHLPPEGYQMLSPVSPVNWPNVQPIKIHGAIQATLKLGYVSFRPMRDHSELSDTEISEWRHWLVRNRIGKIDGRGGVTITPSGKADLERLSPIARGLR